jgi:dihydrofolate reductase
MRSLIYNAAVSLDGFIACTDGSASWIVEDDSIDFDALFATYDYFVMGRKTYEVMLSFGEPSLLSKLSKEAVVVISRTMKQEEHSNVTVVSGDYLQYIRDLKASVGKDIWLMGGAEVAGPCLENGLVDGIDMAIMPVVLGRGIKMFGTSEDNDGKSWKLKLESVEKLENSGILMTKYSVLHYDNA